jgi:DNA-binding transcriptional MocR family regulator
MDRLYYPRGLLALREAIAEHYNGINLVTSARQILVTNGAQQALSLLGSLYLQRGDTVLIEDPTYYGAVDAFRAAGARLSSLPVGKEGVSPTIMRERISSTAARLVYLTPTFQNPTGSVMPVLARKAIAKIATELGTPVIDDCCLSDVVLDGEVPPPLAFYGDPETLITVGGLAS